MKAVPVITLQGYLTLNSKYSKFYQVTITYMYWLYYNNHEIVTCSTGIQQSRRYGTIYRYQNPTTSFYLCYQVTEETVGPAGASCWGLVEGDVAALKYSCICVIN